MGIGRAIRIYLDDGSVTGIRHAEIVNWTGQAIASPRIQTKALTNWPEAQRPGVYFLFGVDSKSGDVAVYIGEAENVYERLKSHIANKDFWNEVVFFTSKDENLTKSHIKYLESRSVQLAKKTNRYVVLNKNKPHLPNLPRGDRDSMEEFISNLRILLGVIGYKALEILTLSETKEQADIKSIDNADNVSGKQLSLKIKDVHATALLVDEGLIVLSGSSVSNTTRTSMPGGYGKLRMHLIENGVIKKVNDSLQFTSNYLFSSSSQAAAVIVGYSINGRNSWKTDSGVTLKQLEQLDESSE